MGPKFRKSTGGYISWIAGTAVRYIFIFGSGYYDLVRKKLKKKVS